MAQSNNVKTFALTDINNTSACLDFVRLSFNYGIKPILGVDFRNGADQKFILIAKNNNGFEKINNYLSDFLHQKDALIPNFSLAIKDTYVIYPFHKYTGWRLKENEYLGVSVQDLSTLKFLSWKGEKNKLVILQTVSFQNKRGFNAHRLLRAIDNNTLLSKLPVNEQGDICDKMLPENELKNIFEDFPELITNTQYLLDSCSIEFDFSGDTPSNQKSYTDSEEDDYELLRKFSYDGMDYRYGESPEKEHLIKTLPM